MIKPEISRVNRSKKQAQSTYDQLSRWYDWIASSSELPLARLGLQKLCARPGEKVLEIGCGTGHSLQTLAQDVSESGRVFGLDLSRRMLVVTRQRLGHEKLSGWALLGQADATHLPIANAAFDAVFMSFVLELFDTPEIPIVLAECKRILKPAGRVCIVAMVRDEKESIPLKIYEWFHRQLPGLVDCRPIFVQSSLETAGFQIQFVLREMMWGLPVEICTAQN